MKVDAASPFPTVSDPKVVPDLLINGDKEFVKRTIEVANQIVCVVTAIILVIDFNANDLVPFKQVV